MGLSLLAIFLSWFFLHTYFALHYARIYYREEDAGQYTGGLEFPHPGLVDYWDFM